MTENARLFLLGATSILVLGGLVWVFAPEYAKDIHLGGAGKRTSTRFMRIAGIIMCTLGLVIAVLALVMP